MIIKIIRKGSSFLFLGVILILVASCANPFNNGDHAEATLAKTATFENTAIRIPTITPTAIITPSFTATPAMNFTKPVEPITVENASKVTELARMGKGEIFDYEYSPDGKYLAIASSVGVYFYDTKSYQQVKSIDIQAQPLSIKFSSDGKLMAVGCQGSKLMIVNIPDNKIIQTIKLDPSVPWTGIFAFSPDGKIIAILVYLSDNAQQNESISNFSVSTGKLILNKSITNTEDQTIQDFSGDFALSPDDQELSFYRNGNIEFWNIFSNTLIKKIPTETQVDQLTFSPDGKIIAGVSKDKEVKLWNLTDGSTLPLNLSLNNDIQKLIFSPDGNLLTALSSKNIRQWNFKTNKVISDLYLSEDCSGVHPSLNENSYACKVNRDDITIFNLANNEVKNTILDFWPEMYSVVDFAPDGSRISIGHLKIVVSFLDPANGNVLSSGYTKDNYYPTQFAYSPDGKIFAYATDGSITLLKASDGTFLRSLPGYSCVAISADSQMVAGASGADAISVWRVSDGQLLTTFPGHTDTGCTLSFSQDGQYLASGSTDETIKLWQLSNGKLVHTLNFKDNALASVKFLPDGKTFVSGSYNGAIILWDPATEKEITRQNINGFADMALSPDGKIIAVSSLDGSISLFDSSNLHLLNKLKGHTDYVNGIVFSPDGKEIVSVSGDDTLRIWGVMP